MEFTTALFTTALFTTPCPRTETETNYFKMKYNNKYRDAWENFNFVISFATRVYRVTLSLTLVSKNDKITPNYSV